MSVVPPPHQRILPHMDISEQGLRELELWLRRIFKGDGGLLYHKGTYGPENNGDWLHVTTTDGGESFTVGGDVHNISGTFSIGLAGGGSVAIGAAGADASIWLVADDTIYMRAEGLSAFFAAQSIIETDGLTLNTGSYWQSITDELVFDVRGDTAIGNSTSGGNITFTLTAGMGVQVNKSAGSPVFRVNEDSSQVTNLEAGKTVVINDHLGSPLVTYTG